MVYFIRCCICYDRFEPDQSLSVIQCGEACHEDCLKQHQKTSNLCPVCRVRFNRCGKLRLNFIPEQMSAQQNINEQENHTTSISEEDNNSASNSISDNDNGKLILNYYLPLICF